MGTQMACLTPSRGFAAELATALVILVSSQWVSSRVDMGVGVLVERSWIG
jgi:phosphate/sulfate permease